jgi:hypothetical protein
MALIRGAQGKFPCPICFIPKDEQSDLTQVYDLRTAKDTQKTLKAADALEHGTAKEALLKSKGLRYIKVSGNSSDLGHLLTTRNLYIECLLAYAKI